MAKINVDTIREDLASQNWELLSETYRNLDEPLEFRCNNGHTVYAPWKTVRGTYACPICKKNKYAINTHKMPTQKGDRLLALDQSSHVTGYAIFEGHQLIDYGIFEAPAEEEEIVRFNAVKERAISLIDSWNIKYVAIEGIQYEANFGVTTFQTLARLQGVLMEMCYELEKKFIICPTNTWRNYCQVKGRTRVDKKRSMQMLIKEWFDIQVQDDIADAIGIGRYAASRLVRPKMESWE